MVRFVMRLIMCGQKQVIGGGDMAGVEPPSITSVKFPKIERASPATSETSYAVSNCSV
jgi:hypothetical protein